MTTFAFEARLPAYTAKARAYLASDMGRANFAAMLTGKHPHCGGKAWSFERAIAESVMFATGLFSPEHVEAVTDEVIIDRLGDPDEREAA